MEDKPQPQRRTAKVEAKKVTHVSAMIERRHYSSDGKRLSPPPYRAMFNVQEWLDFKKHGASLGLYLVKVLELPEGIEA